MQSYILILLGVLVILLIGVIYFGWRRILNLEIENNKNKYDIEALRGLLNKILSDSSGGEEFNLPQSNQYQEAEILKMLQQQQMQQSQQKQSNPQNKKEKIIDDETEDDTLESSDENEEEIPEIKSIKANFICNICGEGITIWAEGTEMINNT